MTDYRTLSEVEKLKVDEEIINAIPQERKINKHNGFEWNEPDETLMRVHEGFICAICWRSHYTCLCSHEN